MFFLSWRFSKALNWTTDYVRFQGGRSSLLAELVRLVVKSQKALLRWKIAICCTKVSILSERFPIVPTVFPHFPMVFPCFSDQRSFPPAVRGQLLRLGLGSHWLVPRPCAGLHHPETSRPTDFSGASWGSWEDFWGRFQMVTWMGLNRIFDRSLMGYVYIYI